MSADPLPSLPDLYRAHTGKVSDKWASYLTLYDRLFAPYRLRPVRLLEIGIQNGGSLELWAKFFPAATAIVGCDINEACRALQYDDPRISLVVGDANAPDVAERIRAISPTFDIVIDDGSHTSRDIVQSFCRYFPALSSGGLFVAEDLHCSYWQEYGGGLHDPLSSIAFFKRLVDVVNFEHWGVAKPRDAVFAGFAASYGARIDSADLAAIDAVSFHNSVAVVQRGAAPNSVGRRMIVGATAAVVPGVAGIGGTPMTPLSQRSNIWTNGTETADGGYRRDLHDMARRRLRDLRRGLGLKR
jgi:hypothetical protein